ncbi:MAG: DUF4347 domain-containing protein [Elainella sp.]
MTMIFSKTPSLLLIDAAVADYQHFMDGADLGYEVVRLYPNQDGIDQITALLAERQELESLHILSHGGPGTLQIGSTLLNLESLIQSAEAVRGWAKALAERASIFIYGCQVAAGPGEAFLQQLHRLTGAAIAAATTKIGRTELGGGSVLDVVIGQGRGTALSPERLATYPHTLPVILNETFTGNTVTGTWLFGQGGASAQPFLTASPNVTAPPGGLPGSASPIDPAGAGTLRLTNNANNQSAFVIYNTPFASNAGISIEFDFFAYDGTGLGTASGGDGISFFLIDGATTAVTAGAFGGSLGYAQKIVDGITGIEGGYLGIGLDEFGNFSNQRDFSSGGIQRSGPAGSTDPVPDSVSLRGRVGASGLTGYDFIAGSGTLPGGIDNAAATSRTAALRRARLDISPTGVLGVRVDLNGDGDYLDAGEVPPTLNGLNVNTVNPGGIPATFKFGFASSTGNATNIHEVRNLTISTFSTPPTVTDTSVSVTPNSIVNLTGLSGTDAETSIASFTIITVPPAAQGTLFLGNPLAGGTPIAAGQTITPAQLPQIFFQAVPGFTGSTFVYTATDTDADTAQTPGTVTLTPSANQAPSGTNTTVNVTPGSPSAINNLPATDPDGSVAAFTIVTLPPAGQGTLFLGTTPVTAGQVLTPAQVGLLVFQPSANFTGSSFTFSPIDNLGAVDATPATVTLNRSNNQPPTLPGDSTTQVSTNDPVQIPGLNGRDPDGTVSGYVITAIPPASQGSLFIGDPTEEGRPIALGQRVTPAQINQIFFRPAAGFSNTSFTYAAIDDDGALSDPRTITLSRLLTPGPTGDCGPGRNLRAQSNANSRLIGGVGNDRLTGRNGNDTLEGRNCDDRLAGGRGRDRLLGGNDVDTLLGQQSSDRVAGGRGADRLFGGLGRDSMNGGAGNDQLTGGRGDDFLKGGGNIDVINAGRGQDRVQGNAGDDNLNGAQNNDRVDGGNGFDILNGGLQRDQLLGRGGIDELFGRRGNDNLKGGSQADFLSGGRNFDTLIGGGGADTLNGGGNRDRFVYRNARHGLDTILDFERIDRIDLRRVFAGGDYTRTPRFNRYVRLASAGSDTIVRVDANGNAPQGFVDLVRLAGVAPDQVTSRNFLV